MNIGTTQRQARFAALLKEFLDTQDPQHKLNLEGPGTNSLAAWFLGPRAENGELFGEMLGWALAANISDRRTLFPDDPPYVTDARRDREYHKSVARMKKEYLDVLEQLRGSVPFFSYRYQAHMNWDLTMPAMLGYFAAMLYNQNNVALEASPVTSVLEQHVGNDLCRMLGYDLAGTATARPWGHITCDGSVANLESMWAARNLKYYPLSVKAVLLAKKELEAARALKVSLVTGETVVLVEQDTWTLLNLDVDVILGLPAAIQAMCQKLTPDKFVALIDPYLLQTMGLPAFLAEYGQGMGGCVVLGPATKHYSWPKNAALTGLGKGAFVDVMVDEYARMDLQDLENRLSTCVAKKQPVIMVVVVMGSTEESAVDPLAKVVELRAQYRKRGVDFVIHADAAWGGYFASILRGPDIEMAPENATGDLQATPALQLSDYVTAQYQALPSADSITIDPHKAGYVPYAAGGLCYRNGAMRNLVAFLAPEVYHGDQLDANMGIYGVEGSKPGAAAAGVFLSHRIIRPDRTGYGKILGQALFNSKRFYAAIVTAARVEDDFFVVPVQQLPAERSGQTPDQLAAQLEFIRTHIVEKQNNEIIKDTQAFELLKLLGSDQIIITYGLNFRRSGVPNSDPVLANEFMQDVFGLLSLQADASKTPDLIVTTSTFGPKEYGPKFVLTYMNRLGLKLPNDGHALPTMTFLSSTTMCPWLTETATGNFIPELIRAFRAAVKAVLEKSKYC